MIGFLFIQAVHLADALDIRSLKVILAVFLLSHIIDIPISEGRIPLDLAEVIVPLQSHGDAFQPISQLNGNWVEVQAPRLLEISELGDFLSIQPHFPAKPPSTQRRRLPIILYEADIMLFWFYA